MRHQIRPICLGVGCVMTAHVFGLMVYFVTLGFILGNKSYKCLARVFVPLEKNLFGKSNVSPKAAYEFGVMLVDFFLKKRVLYLCTVLYVYECLPACIITPLCTWCPWRSEKGSRSSGTKDPDGCESSCGCWEWNPSLLLDSRLAARLAKVLLLVEPSHVARS